MIIAIETKRFWVEFEAEGSFSHDSNHLELKFTDLEPESRELLQQIFKGGLWIGMNNPQDSHSVNLVLNKGEPFKNVRWTEVRTKNSFLFRGTYG